MIVNRLEILLGDSVFCRNTIIVFFIANETLSLVENMGLMGAPYPQWLKNALEVLSKQSQNKGDAKNGDPAKLNNSK